MNRRELIKAIVPLSLTPILVKGNTNNIKSIEIKEQTSKYIILVNPTSRLDPEQLSENLRGILPEGTPILVGFEEDLKIFKID